MTTLDRAKAHLNITTNVDDALITRLLAAAQDWLERQIGYTFADRYPPAGSPAVSTVPPGLEQGVLLMTGHWYANREATLVGVNAQTLPFGVSDIVNAYRDWSWGEPDDE